jgi:hypothetical protein
LNVDLKECVKGNWVSFNPSLRLSANDQLVKSLKKVKDKSIDWTTLRFWNRDSQLKEVEANSTLFFVDSVGDVIPIFWDN